MVDPAVSKAGRTLSKLGASKGGKTAAANMTDDERSERAHKAASARWAKRKAQAEAHGQPGEKAPDEQGSAAHHSTEGE